LRRLDRGDVDGGKTEVNAVRHPPTDSCVP
jgi:hypothetical protein